MAGFQTKTFLKYDDYMTPKYAWENIQHLIPKDKVIWEAFYGDGDSGNYLTELGFKTIHEPVDFFENDLGDIIVSNPPFKGKRKIFERALSFNKPFALLMTMTFMNEAAPVQLFEDRGLQLLLFDKRIEFIQPNAKQKGKITFNSSYYCWNFLPNDIVMRRLRKTSLAQLPL